MKDDENTHAHAIIVRCGRKGVRMERASVESFSQRGAGNRLRSSTSYEFGIICLSSNVAMNLTLLSRSLYITLRWLYLAASRPSSFMSAFQRGGSSSKTYVSGKVSTPLPPMPRSCLTVS